MKRLKEQRALRRDSFHSRRSPSQHGSPNSQFYNKPKSPSSLASPKYMQKQKSFKRNKTLRKKLLQTNNYGSSSYKQDQFKSMLMNYDSSTDKPMVAKTSQQQEKEVQMEREIQQRITLAKDQQRMHLPTFQRIVAPFLMNVNNLPESPKIVGSLASIQLSEDSLELKDKITDAEISKNQNSIDNKLGKQYLYQKIQSKSKKVTNSYWKQMDKEKLRAQKAFEQLDLIKMNCIGSQLFLKEAHQQVDETSVLTSKDYKALQMMFKLQKVSPSLDQAKMFFKVRERKIFNERLAWLLVKSINDKKRALTLAQNRLDEIKEGKDSP